MRSLICVAATVTLSFFASTQGSFAALQQGSVIPATAPTQGVAGQSGTANLTRLNTVGGVTWNGSVLAVDAGGESLRSVLARVARATGMKVSGGVPDEPVFGSYGPGPVQEVLTTLFDGLNVNMLLVNGSPVLPKELVLTARTGGPTPPLPAQPLSAADDPANVNLAQPQPAEQIGRHNSPNSFQQLPQASDQPGSNTAGPAVPLNNGTNAGQTTDANGTPQSPNGTRTPEQIFDELRRRQQGNTAPQ